MSRRWRRVTRCAASCASRTNYSATDRLARMVPAPGTAWVDERALTRLSLKSGDVVERRPVALARRRRGDARTGQRDRIHQQPAALLMNEVDIAATGLIQTGSRVRYRLYVAGGDSCCRRLSRMGADAHRRRDRASRASAMRGPKSARHSNAPSVTSALPRWSAWFLAAVAIALAARRFLAAPSRWLRGDALPRRAADGNRAPVSAALSAARPGGECGGLRCSGLRRRRCSHHGLAI